MRKLNFPDHSPQQIELLIKRAGPWTPENGAYLNSLSEDRSEHARRSLRDSYGLTEDSFGNYQGLTEDSKTRLLETTFRQAYEGLKQELDSPFSRGIPADDHEDYTRAALLQMNWILSFADDDCAAILRFLNTDEHAALDMDLGCFKYGWADHGTDFSDLARMNEENEDLEGDTN